MRYGMKRIKVLYTASYYSAERLFRSHLHFYQNGNLLTFFCPVVVRVFFSLSLETTKKKIICAEGLKRQIGK